MPRALSTGDEHYIPLADIGVAILQEEYLVNAIVLKRRKLDEEAKRSSEALFDH